MIANYMGPTWGPPGGDRTQVGPMLAPRTLLSGITPPCLYSAKENFTIIQFLKINFARHPFAYTNVLAWHFFNYRQYSYLWLRPLMRTLQTTYICVIFHTSNAYRLWSFIDFSKGLSDGINVYMFDFNLKGKLPFGVLSYFAIITIANYMYGFLEVHKCMMSN